MDGTKKLAPRCHFFNYRISVFLIYLLINFVFKKYICLNKKEKNNTHLTALFPFSRSLSSFVSSFIHSPLCFLFLEILTSVFV
jgi:hypothetical protein